jgi:hypothetical protein
MNDAIAAVAFRRPWVNVVARRREQRIRLKRCALELILSKRRYESWQKYRRA